MNDSGKEIKRLVDHYSLAIDHLYIVHDDLDIPLGSYKIQLGTGPKQHKGLDSINKALGTSDYWHVRVGVDNRDPDNRVPGEEYVLQDFTEDEIKKLKTVINEVVENLCKKLAT